jgi:hypothetical protein
MFSKFDTTPQSDELTAADLYDAQAEWEAEQYEWEWEEVGTHAGAELYAAQVEREAGMFEGEPVMYLPNDLFMVFDDPDYWG